MGLSSQSPNSLHLRGDVRVFASLPFFIIRHVSPQTRYRDIKCDRINHPCVFSLPFPHELYFLFPSESIFYISKKESLLTKMWIIYRQLREGGFALTLLEIHSQTMNDRRHSGNRFLDMVFIFVFPLGHMRTSIDDVLLIFGFFYLIWKIKVCFPFH